MLLSDSEVGVLGVNLFQLIEQAEAIFLQPDFCDGSILDASYPGETIETAVSASCVADANPILMRLLVSNVLKNALEHHDGDQPRVAVRSRESDGDGGEMVDAHWCGRMGPS